MEVFATMLGAQDEMNVYLMSDFGANPTNVKGSDDGRVDQIIGSLGETGNTPLRRWRPPPATSPRWTPPPAVGWWCSPTVSSSTSPPRASRPPWRSTPPRESRWSIWASAPPSSSHRRRRQRLYAYSAGSSAEILPCITEIANQIFQQQILPASHITTSGNTMTLNIDIPVDQLLVFAQGEGSRWRA